MFLASELYLHPVCIALFLCVCVGGYPVCLWVPCEYAHKCKAVGTHGAYRSQSGTSGVLFHCSLLYPQVSPRYSPSISLNLELRGFELVGLGLYPYPLKCWDYRNIHSPCSDFTWVPVTQAQVSCLFSKY